MVGLVLWGAAGPMVGRAQEGAPGKPGDLDTLTGVFSGWTPMMTAGILPWENQCRIMITLTIEFAGFSDYPGLVL